MRYLIRNILNESFLNEKAAPRRRMPTPREVEVKPEEDYNKTGWIHSFNIGKDGKVKIVWKDDVRQLERKYEEIKNLESSIRTIEGHINMVKRDRLSPPGYLVRMYAIRNKHIEDLERLKHQVESETLDNPMIDFFE